MARLAERVVVAERHADRGHADLLVGPRGALEVGVTSVGVAFSYDDPLG